MKMKQLVVMLTVAMGLAVALSGGAREARAAEDEAKRLNVLLILADDMGWGDLGCYGSKLVPTPRIDRLAREGVRFTDAYSSCPFCAPTRAGLLTGRHPFRAGVVNNPAPDAGIDDVGIGAEQWTLAEAMRESGRRTACFGKWHLGHRPEFHPLRHGFDEYEGILYSNDMRPIEVWRNEAVLDRDVVQSRLTERYTERAIEFIRRDDARPWFVYLPHAMPHKPLAASPEFYKKSGAGLYGDVMAELDHHLGRLFDALEESGQAERTIVIFASDNGPWFGGSTGGLRGMKSTGWEGGTRVPLVIRWPGKLPAGTTCSAPVMLPDLFATVLEATGVAAPAGHVLDGKSLLPVAAGTGPGPHEAIYTFRGAQLLAVRRGPWKLHVARPGPANPPNDATWKDPRAPDGVTILAPFEQARPRDYPGLLTGDPVAERGLFNLSDDPGEQHEVSSEHPEIVAELTKLAEAMRAEVVKTTGAGPGRGR
jgi:uncharacterized sulfatase